MFTPLRSVFVPLVLFTLACGESSTGVVKPGASQKPPETSTAPPPTDPLPAPDDAGTPSTTCSSTQCPAPSTDAPPTVSIVEPASGARISAKALVVRGKASDDHAGLKVQVSVDGSHYVDATLVGDTFEVSLPLGDADDDFVTVQAQASDAAGHVMQSLQLIEVDNVAPHASIDPVPLADAQTWLAGVMLHGDADDATLATVRVDLDDGHGFQNAALNKGRWSMPFTPAANEDWKAHLARVEATDGFGHVTTAQLLFHVDVVRPRLTITSPADNQKFNATSFVNGDAVRVAFTVQDGDPGAFTVEQGKSTHLTVLDVQTSPADNGKRYDLILEADDTSGNQDSLALTFYVDRLPPSVVRLAPAEGTVTSDTTAVVTFSEPVQVVNSAFAASPALLGSLNSAHDRFTFNLGTGTSDTAYTVGIPPVADDFGNVAPAQPAWHFVTAPAQPGNGLVIASGVTSFSAAADEDGVLTVVAAQGSTARSYRFDAHSGAMIVDAAVSIQPGTPLLADAYRRNVAGGAPERISGARFTTASGFQRVDWWLNRSLMPTPNLTSALIPTPAIDGEGTGLGTVGFIRSMAYERSGRADLAVSVRPDHVASVDGRWELVQVDLTGFTRQSFSCSKPFSNAAPVCDLTPAWSVYGFGSTPRYSHAVTKNCSLHVYNDMLGNRLMFIEPFVTGCRIGSCPSTTTIRYAPTDEIEVSTATPTIAMAAWRVSAGVVTREIIPDLGCSPILGQAAQLTASNIVSFRPVRIGGQPGLVWLDTNGTLQLFRN